MLFEQERNSMTELSAMLFLLLCVFVVFRVQRRRRIENDIKTHINEVQMVVFCKTLIEDNVRYHKIEKVWKGDEYLSHVSQNGFLGKSAEIQSNMKFGPFSLHFIFIEKASDKFSIGVGSHALYEYKGKYQFAYLGRKALVSVKTFEKVLEKLVA
jgi:hypothetical protein